MEPVIPVSVLREAAERTWSYLEKWGVLCEWKLTERGLQLDSSYGANEVKQVVDWDSLSQAHDPSGLLRMTEEYALRGLSS